MHPIKAPPKQTTKTNHQNHHHSRLVFHFPHGPKMTTTSQPPSPFSFPREYSFPPFFTRQTNLTTHHAQLVKWSSLILSYCRHHRIFRLPLSPSTSDSSSSELFHNRKLDKRLSTADIREIIEFMRKDGRAEYVGNDTKGDVVWVYWRSPEEWAGLIEEWVEGTGQKGTVLTVYELREGEGTRGAGTFFFWFLLQVAEDVGVVW